ncbi:MAG: DUF4143 domain-containing protein, partial [Candidatus Dadabacteria bacterium]|nr:DUF4143 domain-containing protein [Candidatus Dadabacteria bacterium]
TNYNDLLGHPVAGGSWEGFVLENILSVAPPEARSYYYRTPGGAEIDLVLEFGMRDRWAVEIKRSSAPSLSRGFHMGCEDVNASRKYVVYSGSDTFSMESGVTAISLHGLMTEIVKQGK